VLVERMLSVLRRKSADAPWVGLLAWKGKMWWGETTFSRSLHLPRPITAEWSIEATRPHSQWRNRAGLAPDFPVMPDMGTKGDKTLTRNEMVESEPAKLRITHDRRRVTTAPSRAAAPALLSARDQNAVRDGTAAPGPEMRTVTWEDGRPEFRGRAARPAHPSPDEAFLSTLRTI